MEKFRLDREDVVIFIIDIQERLAPVIRDKDKIINNNQILLEAAKEIEIPVIATEQYPKGLGSTVDQLREYLPAENIFAKNSFTAYIDQVEEKLKSLDRKKIIVTGMEGHICVYQTSRDLIEEGYKVHIVEDGVGSRTKNNLNNGLEQMREMGAVINNTESVIFDLLKVAGTPEFKKISQLIK